MLVAAIEKKTGRLVEIAEYNGYWSTLEIATRPGNMLVAEDVIEDLGGRECFDVKIWFDVRQIRENVIKEIVVECNERQTRFTNYWEALKAAAELAGLDGIESDWFFDEIKKQGIEL